MNDSVDEATIQRLADEVGHDPTSPHEAVRVPRVDLGRLFDMCVNSMDFGSGLMDNDDVQLLRRIAVLLGVDPWNATPEAFRRNYPHAFEPFKLSLRQTRVPIYQLCQVCGTEPEHPVHRRQDPT